MGSPYREPGLRDPDPPPSWRFDPLAVVGCLVSLVAGTWSFSLPAPACRAEVQKFVEYRTVRSWTGSSRYDYTVTVPVVTERLVLVCDGRP